jgi:GNAT superfamily N-acetyltransferase
VSRQAEAAVTEPVYGGYAHQWDDYEDPEDNEDEYDTCYHCQRNHNPHEHAGDQTFSPDWHEELPKIPSIHRSVGVVLPDELDKKVHDPATPPHEAASALMHHLTTAYPYQGHTHWSAHQGLEHAEKTFGHAHPEGYHGPSSKITRVMMHAKTPRPDDIEYDNDSLIEDEISPYRHPEYEVPLHPNAPVHLTGVSWSRPQTGRWNEGGSKWHSDPAPAVHHHMFGKPFELTAALDRAAALKRATAAIEHEPTGDGAHWFEHFDSEGNSAGHAIVHERPDHTWVQSMTVNPGERGKGIGAGLLDHVQNHFGKPLRLKPYPIGEREDDPGEEQLRDWYGRRGFTDYERREGDDLDAHDWMERHAAGEILRNPHTQGREWYHGTKASSEQLAGGFRIADSDPDPDWPAHWSTGVGVHFAAHHSMASKFADPNIGVGGKGGAADPWHSTTPSVVHARLHITNPKVYPNEDRMADDVFEHEYDHRKNYISRYLDGGDKEGDKEAPYAASDYFSYDHHPSERPSRGEDEHFDDWEDHSEWGEEQPEPVYRREQWLNLHPDQAGIAKRYRERLQSEGHDGIVYGNSAPDERVRSSKPESNMAAIAFHPHQIEITKHHVHGDEHKTAARWEPSSGVFGPTTGHDPRLFENHELRPEVRRDLMERLDRALRVDTGLVGSDWQDWTRIYLVGGSASEWAGARPNDAAQDLDVVIGVNFFEARRHQSQSDAFQNMDSDQIATAFNSALRAAFNDPDWHPGFGGTWQLTAYVNPLAWDITAIKPYAAYDVSDMKWAVHPPHLPEHSVADFHPAILAIARAVATEVRAVLRLPEPARTREARALWERIHSDRSRAFSGEGEGWEDPGNLIEKYLAYAPGNILGQIKDLVWAQTKTADLQQQVKTAVATGVWYHGTPDDRNWEHGAANGLHIGTEEAARQALNARIGKPHEGEWDGTRPYGRTLLSPAQTTGVERNLTMPRYPSGRATYSDGKQVPADARPNIFPVRVKGEMANTPHDPVHDDYANSRMRGQITRGQARRGYYYTNIGEDAGSLSAVVPSAEHLERIEHEPKTASAEPQLEAHDYEGTAGDPAHITRNESGLLPVDSVRDLHGVNGEQPGHSDWHRTGQEWEDFKGAVARGEGGAGEPIFITVDHGQEPKISEGNQRRDAYVENGASHVPVEVRYFGHAEQQGTVHERAMRRTAAVEPFDEETGEPRPWHKRWEGESDRETSDRRERYVHQVAERHGVGAEVARHAITRVAQDVRTGEPFTGVRGYGYTRSPGDMNDSFYTERRIKALNDPETWRGRKVQHVSTDEVHASQPWLNPPKLAHNLFHPGKDLPAMEGETGHPDIDPDESWEDAGEERRHQDSLGATTRFVRRSDGRLQVGDGHHRAAIDMLLGKETTPGLVINEHELDSPPVRLHGEEMTAPELHAHMLEHHDRTRSELPEPRDANHLDLVDEHDHSHEFDDPSHVHAVRKTASGSDGDDYFTCAKGHEHWGEHGAAGLLIRHRDDDGLYRYLLQKRGPDGTGKGQVDHGGKWSIPSGAIGEGEEPLDGAKREYREEMGSLPQGVTHHHSVTSTNCGDWRFTTHVMDAPERFMPRGRGETEDEVAGAAWHTAKEVQGLKDRGELHPAFAKSWDEVRRSRGQKEAVKGYDPEPRTGMIYLDVPPELIHQVPGGVNDSHITLVYLGKGLSDEQFGEACRRAAKAAAGAQPMEGVLRGVETFPPSDGKTPAFVPAYIPGIGELRRGLEDLSASEHKDYRPHLTLGYLEPGDEMPPPHPPVHLRFTHLHVKRGDQVVAFPLGG